MNLVYPTRYFPTFSSPTYPWNGNNPLIRLVSIENEETRGREGVLFCVKKKKEKGRIGRKNSEWSNWMDTV